MSTFTVTISPTDIDPDGTVPRVGFVTFSRITVDPSGNIVPTDPVSVRVTSSSQSVTLDGGVTYRVRGDGIAGLSTFYAVATSNCTFTVLRTTCQVDPTTLQPVDEVVTVAAAIAAAQAAAATDATAKVAVETSRAQAAEQAIQAALLTELPEWEPNTLYAQAALVVNPSGQIVQALAAFTSGASYDASKWSILSLTVATVAAMIAAQAASDSGTYVALRGAWAAGIAYPANSLVIQAAAAYLALNAVPARTTFTAADWQALGGSAVAPVTNHFLLESGGALLLESGDYFLTA